MAEIQELAGKTIKRAEMPPGTDCVVLWFEGGGKAIIAANLTDIQSGITYKHIEDDAVAKPRATEA